MGVGLLSRDQVSAVARESSVLGRNDRLAAYLISIPYQQLLSVVMALKHTSQQHIINFISPQTGRKHSRLRPLALFRSTVNIRVQRWVHH